MAAAVPLFRTRPCAICEISGHFSVCSFSSVLASTRSGLVAFNDVPCKDVEALDCGHEFFKQIYQQFREATQEIIIMPFLLRPRLKIFSSTPDQEPDTSLTDLIREAVRRRVHVWILGWDNAASEKYLGLFEDHEFELLFESVGEDKQYIHLMLDTGRELFASVYYLPHIKSYVFDRRVAFVGGIDFAENRQDTPEHVRPDSRLVQVAIDARHPTGNEKPWQDAMIKVTGRAAEQVAMIMVERWWTYCKSIGSARAQALRPLSAILDSTVWQVKGALHGSQWKDWQCDQMPNNGVLGQLQLKLNSSHEDRQIRIETPQIQSQYLDANADKFVRLRRGQAEEVDVVGLHALDAKVPGGITISMDGISMRVFNTTQTLHHDGSTLTAKWLPEGAGEQGEQMCKVTLSGSNMWMGTSTIVQESYTVFLNMIRNAKRFVFIENQYFSSDFPSSSPECQHAHQTSAVLYSGATNRVAEVLLDRIKHAALLKESFSVAIIFPLGTEPGSFYPNLRGAYCFEQTVEDFWKAHAIESDWREYFSFFFLANAVHVERPFGGPAAAFYGIFTHTKAIVVDDEISYVGSANINDRSLLGDRDAEVGITTWGGPFPKQLRETLMKHHTGDGFSEINPSRLVSSMKAVAEANAEELRHAMGISFPQGTFRDSRGARQLFGMEGLLNHTPTQDAELPYPRSRVVAGGGGVDHFDWFVVPNASRPLRKPMMQHDSSDYILVACRLAAAPYHRMSGQA
ncbi:PLPZETA2 [Symbiodinium natans]|uniref:phospholipase D n=1 Tax=Symbiodinium natans TaxID=878477 RepID=A0A812Q6R5_9DINO|nr:PLPZETA2 [Symbiodinium natans]